MRGEATKGLHKDASDAGLLDSILKNNKLSESHDREMKKTKALQLQLSEEKRFSKELQDNHRKLEHEFAAFKGKNTQERGSALSVGQTFGASAIADTHAKDAALIKELKDEIAALKKQAGEETQNNETETQNQDCWGCFLGFIGAKWSSWNIQVID